MVMSRISTISLFFSDSNFLALLLSWLAASSSSAMRANSFLLQNTPTVIYTHFEFPNHQQLALFSARKSLYPLLFNYWVCKLIILTWHRQAPQCERAAPSRNVTWASAAPSATCQRYHGQHWPPPSPPRGGPERCRAQSARWSPGWSASCAPTTDTHTERQSDNTATYTVPWNIDCKLNIY